MRRPKAAGDCVLLLTDPPPNIPLLTNGSGTLYPLQSKANDEIIISGGKCATASCPSTTNQLQTYSTNQVDVCCDSSGLVVSYVAIRFPCTLTSLHSFLLNPEYLQIIHLESNR